MNLINGKPMNNKEALESLPALVLAAKEEPFLPPERVIAACDALSRALDETELLPLLIGLGMTEEKARRELAFAREVISRGYLEERLRREGISFREESFVPLGSDRAVRQRRLPLGTILHIAAGNADALPVFSVLEGLLTGNINILKLPSGDGGLSVLILKRLMELEPALKSRVFVFDIPSENTEAIQKMASAADAVVVWGGDAAVRAVRSLAPPDTRIIEWGHKLSFAYVSGEASDDALIGLCENICVTEQLLCSSCQGVFLDTESIEELDAFASRFSELLSETAKKYPTARGKAALAQRTLELYTDELEAPKTGARIIKKPGCSVTVLHDRALTPSRLFRDPWVRALPKSELVKTLSPYKNRLQTAALICPEADRPALESALFAAGVVRITAGSAMSSSYCGMPHDGEMPLQRYTRIVSAE